MKEIHIGIAGPCLPRLFAQDLDVDPETLPKGRGGTPVNHLVRALLDKGYQITLATLDVSHSDENPVTFRGKLLSLTIGPYRPQKRARNMFRQERGGIKKGFLLIKPDVISAHWSYEYALGSIATGIPTMVTVRDVPKEIFKLQPSLYRLVRWWMHRQAISKASRLAFNSPYTKLALGYAESDPGMILPNVLPDNQFVFDKEKKMKSKAPTFISINSGFSALKNVGRLLEAFNTVRKALPEAKLILIGQGYESKGPALSWAKKNGLTKGIEFKGPVEYQEVATYLKLADILVHPSLEESFGYTLIEAASLGTPVIGGRSSGAVPWVLANGQAGVLVDVTDKDAIASAMTTLAASPEEWERLRNRAFYLAKERFSASRVAESYVQALKELC